MKEALKALALALCITAGFPGQAATSTCSPEMTLEASLGVTPEVVDGLLILDSFIEPILRGDVTAPSFLDTWTQDLLAQPHLQGSESDVSDWIAASPQPKPYALVFTGLGLLGFIAHRRHKARGLSHS